MPDRRRRTDSRPPQPSLFPRHPQLSPLTGGAPTRPVGAPSAPLLRERQPSPHGGSDAPGATGSGTPDTSGTSGGQGTPGEAEGRDRPSPAAPVEDNPFAAPPQGRPDQPWRPRHPSHPSAHSGRGDGQGGGNGQGNGPSDDRPVWGSQWSDRQPGREGGDFGRRPGAGGGPERPDGGRGGMRWDPTDPAQRRARYAVLSGMWAFFFVLFGFPEIALLLGALGTYWAISSLRADPKPPAPADGPTGSGHAGTTPAPGAQAPGGAPAPGSVPPGGQPVPGAPGVGKPQTTAAVSGLVTALLALAMVAGTFTVQLVYRDYYTCVDDALTRSSALACNDLLPDPLEPIFGVKN
ncbi:hypothetical protein [Streptomyces sp. NBC_00102]|uniref:hypothetical protein n=1 Tax=Streptomyces sp. NBC_00102 TaxID=2975652 RepID=UPI00224D599F|nr:hypothetical protein [Streptomyces sp. NBC_00102]MCX5399229.1 hypothetical protein [Streptomyces sp. NBC_00102]